MPSPRSRAAAALTHFKRNRNPAKASTALIITVNREHHATVEQAAPDGAEPGKETALRGLWQREPGLGRVLTHQALLR
jgi:hypothetical protein